MNKEKHHTSFSPYSEDETKRNVKINIKVSADNTNPKEMVQELANRFSDKQKYENEIYDIVELEKNEDEIRAIKMAQEGFNEFFSGLGLPIIEFDISKIHILSQQEFDEKINLIDQKQSAGKYAFGHIYCIRGDEFDNFLHKLVHELVHKSSFYFLSVDASLNETHIRQKQSGLSYNKGKNNHLFNGLNEAVTELITIDIWQIIAKNNNFQSEKEGLIHHVSYYPQIIVLEELLDNISNGDKEFKEEMMKDIYRANYNGNYSFLREFEKRHKGSIKILREMEDSNESALETAKKLKLKEAQERVTKIIKMKQ